MRDIRKLQLTNELKARQQIVDIKIQACKRNDDKGQAFKIEHLQINNPQLFWFMMNNLGPKRVKSIQMELLHIGHFVFMLIALKNGKLILSLIVLEITAHLSGIVVFCKDT